MSNIVDLPQDPARFLIGPFEEWRVCIEGRFIPGLSGKQNADGSITLVVDRRFSADVPADVAYSVAWLLAQAMAVGAGYSSANADEKSRPFGSQSMLLPEAPK